MTEEVAPVQCVQVGDRVTFKYRGRKLTGKVVEVRDPVFDFSVSVPGEQFKYAVHERYEVLPRKEAMCEA